MSSDNRSDDEVVYHFEFEDGTSWRFQVSLTGEDWNWTQAQDLPDWTRLDFHQCSHCPLSTDEHVRCPYAAALAEPATVTAMRVSFEQVSVRVLMRNREVRASTTLQRGMGSLLGLLGALSGCPHTNILKPMARYHLPFSSSDESLFRVMGTFLLGQYVRQQHQLSTDWQLTELRRIYGDLRQVNRGMSQRLKAAQEKDTGINSIVLLDLLAADVEYALKQYEGDLDENFREFLDRPGES